MGSESPEVWLVMLQIEEAIGLTDYVVEEGTGGGYRSDCAARVFALFNVNSFICSDPSFGCAIEL